MKAQVLKGISQLEYEEVQVPECPKGWVLVKVHAAGVCGSDIPRIFVNGTYHFPTIPGHEFSGEVVKTHVEDEQWLGKRVGIFPLIPCKTCTSCQKQHYEMCEHYNYLGSRCDGGFAEYVAVPEWNLIELPEQVSYEQAAMLEPSCVALHGINRVHIEVDDTVVIYGSGTIAFLMAQWCRIKGAKQVLMVGTRQEQRELFQDLGFEKGNFKLTSSKNEIDNSDVEWVMDKTNKQGTNVAIECVGTSVTTQNTIMSAKAGGRILLTGNPVSDIDLPKAVYWRILRKQLSLTGTWNSSFKSYTKNDWNETLQAMDNGLLKNKEMITHKVELKDLYKALEMIRNKHEYTNKVMVVMR